jgi:hypothetical protein
LEDPYRGIDVSAAPDRLSSNAGIVWNWWLAVEGGEASRTASQRSGNKQCAVHHRVVPVALDPRIRIDTI